MSEIAHLQRMNIGSSFRAFTLRLGEMAALIDPFLGMCHAWISAPTFQPHPHAEFSALSCLLLDSQTGGINRRDSG
jgi:redox-sensitive bicupin YhaK (pirin superfamily)